MITTTYNNENKNNKNNQVHNKIKQPYYTLRSNSMQFQKGLKMAYL